MLTKLLENFASKPGMVRADTTRNLLIVQGNGADRQSAIRTALSFDADWMRGQSVGIYPVSNSMPEPVIAELEKIIDAGEGGIGQNIIKLQPIARQNAILVVTRKPELLNRVSTWIERLDKSDISGTGLKVYRMRYGDARQIANLLNDMFVGPSSGLDTPANQLAPGSGVVASSSGSTRGSQLAASLIRAVPPAWQGRPRHQQARASTHALRNSPGARFAQNTTGTSIVSSASSSRPGSPGEAGAGGAILPNIRISADVANNSLLIYANQENYRIIERALEKIDRPQLQVAIDATIAEVTLNDNLAYGVQFFLKSKDVGLKPDKRLRSSTPRDGAAINRVLPGFNFLVGTEAEPQAHHRRPARRHRRQDAFDAFAGGGRQSSRHAASRRPNPDHDADGAVGIVPGAPVVNNIDYRNTGMILRVAPASTPTATCC